MSDSDVLVLGAGHNGLVAALLLAKAGLSVRVLEEKAVVGGACRTERPFARAPDLGTSTGAYLLGLMPPELLEKTGLGLPLRRRDPHYFLPTTGDGYLLLGSDQAAAKRQFEDFFSAQDFRAHTSMNEELAEIRDDIAPTWLKEPLSVLETAERYVRPARRQAFVDLCEGSVGDYLERFSFRSDRVKAMYAVTDGFSGMLGGWDTPGTGMNFLVHNMCRLPGADGTWMLVQGGMGAVTASLASLAMAHGAVIETGRKVESIVVEGGVARGVLLQDGAELRARAVVCNADPFRMRDMVGEDRLPAAYNARLDGYRRDGSTLKVNLALSGMPRFTCLPEARGQHQATIHLLPEGDVLGSLRSAFEQVRSGQLADFPSIEWYTTADPILAGGTGLHNSALFVQWVPHTIAGSSWEAEEERYTRHLLSICDRFAPGTSSLVVDTFTLTPPKIESYFGITRGHIHHVDNSFGFDRRLPYRTPLQGLYSCSAGTHPAGAVIGAAGHNAAMSLLEDLGKARSTG